MKRNLFQVFCLVALFCLTLFGCDGLLDNMDGSQNSSFDVYVAGKYSTGLTSNPCYWKNGVKTDLPTDGYANGWAKKIIISGDDIYILGSVGDEKICYWKNGVLSVLPFSNYGHAGDIAVSNGDVYIVGSSLENGKLLPYCWKNGERTALLVGNYPIAAYIEGAAYDITISSDAIYISGAIKFWCVRNTEFYIPCIWKDSLKTDLIDTLVGERESTTSGISVSGNDVYISGWYDNNGDTIPCYWKNGICNDLPLEATDQIAKTKGIAISGSNMYVIGYSENGSAKQACYWRNGSKNILAGGNVERDSEAYAITVSGDDVFIAGAVDVFFEYDGANFVMGSTACYWKNGTINILSNNSSANGIYIVKKDN